MTNNSYLAIKTATTLIILLFISSGVAFAHSGRTDANNCHTDHAKTEEHCHKELLALATSTEITEEIAETAEIKEEPPATAEVTEEVEKIKTDTPATAAEATEEVEEVKKDTPATAAEVTEEVEEIKEETPVIAEITEEVEEIKEETPATAEIVKEVKEEISATTEVTEKSATTVEITEDKSSSTNSDSELTYEEGIKEGIRQCQKDPTSCGIAINPYARVPRPWVAPGYRYYPPRRWYPPYPPRRY
ncbi:secreted protein [Beggiatoa sp. PS]|nr:secreted protein [Beggiatoa sp. PS]